MKNKWLLAIIALSLSVSASADLITFDPTGGGNGFSNAQTFDWKPGNALAIGGNPAGGLNEGDGITLLYQANLGTVLDDQGSTLFSNGADGNYFTLVAGFEETVDTVTRNGAGDVTSVTFAFNDKGDTNFFKIYALDAQGNNLSGEGFTDDSVVLSGTITGQNFNSNFSTNGEIGLFDGNGTDDYNGFQSIIGSGSSALIASVDFQDEGYFPTFNINDLLVSLENAKFNTSQVTPFNQVDPSKAFINLTGTQSAETAPDLGSINGQPQSTDHNFQLQADANNSFTTSAKPVPEPATVALLGAGLGILGFMRRRRG